MDEWEELRAELVSFVRRKFYSRPSVAELAEDIVNQAFVETMVNPEKCNFGYLSKVCIHAAYRYFKRSDQNDTMLLPFSDTLDFMDENDVVEEIIQSENSSEILASLQTLKEIERIVIWQRYYVDFSFAEIAEQNHIKLSTVLSHHRRALEKLRPHLTGFACERSKSNRTDALQELNHFKTLF